MAAWSCPGGCEHPLSDHSSTTCENCDITKWECVSCGVDLEGNAAVCVLPCFCGKIDWGDDDDDDDSHDDDEDRDGGGAGE